MDKEREDMWVRSGTQLRAARKMLAVLKSLAAHEGWATSNFPRAIALREAIKEAEKAGIEEIK